MYFLLGLIGHPVEHSLSPPMHKAAFAHYGLSGDYRLIDIFPERLGPGVSALVDDGFSGFNVTVPYKSKVIELLGDLTGEARRLKAVNTVVIHRTGKTVGHNTDLGGFMLSLSERWVGPSHDKVAVVLGSGGAARAAVWGLIELGWPCVFVVARNAGAGQRLVEEVAAKLAGRQPGGGKVSLSFAGPQALDCTPDLLVNCTPVGIYQDAPPDWMVKAVSMASPAGMLFDMVYMRSGKPTPLVESALSRGLSACDGVSMLVYQAALAFNFWTGRAGPVDVMRQALESARLMQPQ